MRKKAIRIELFQQTANWRIPNSYNIRLTYPLPPYSTVLGMIHAACNFKEYHEMFLSIQGYHVDEHVALNTAYFFGTGKYDPSRHSMKVTAKKGDIGISRGLMHTHVLNEIHLTIYILPNESDFNNILECLKSPKRFLSLGRYEDIVRIDAVDVVELDEMEDDSEYGFNGCSYVPVDLIDEEIRGTVYSLNRKFYYDKKKLRQWESTIRAVCLSKPPFLKKAYEDHKNETLVVFA